MQALDLLLNRVSVGRLLEPAPDAAQRELMFRAALRAPDHGQLRPWRFITVEGEARRRLGELFAGALASVRHLKQSSAEREAQQAAVEANLARLQNQVTLYRVLGGGWSDPAPEAQAAR